MAEAIDACKRTRSEGMTATLDYLGENVRTPEEAGVCRDVCLRMLEAMRQAGLEPCISLKPTQLGMDLSESVCEENVSAVVSAAEAMGGFVYLDMESSQYTERTLVLVSRLHRHHPACGTVIQSYLRRSESDIRQLEQERIRIRLCKGAYLEHPDVAFARKSEVDQSYVRLARELLTGGEYPAIATHDEAIINALESFTGYQGIARDRFEFQMLYGIRRDLQRRLVSEGYRLRLYIPFGDAWYPYFMRRLAERPANLLFFLRQVFRSGA